MLMRAKHKKSFCRLIDVERILFCRYIEPVHIARVQVDNHILAETVSSKVFASNSDRKVFKLKM